MAKTVYIKTSRTGGGAGALDGIDGQNLIAGDLAIVIRDNIVETFQSSTDASVEKAPNVYTPDSNSSSWNWKNLSNWVVTTTSAPSQATGKLPNRGVTILTSTKAGTYVLAVPSLGISKEVVSNSTFLFKIKGSTAATVKFQSTHTVISLQCTSTKIANGPGRSLRLMGASTVLWRVMGATTKGITYATAT